MDSKVNTIHIHQESTFDRAKLIILMIPCLVFLLVLMLYITLSSYSNPTHTAASSSYKDANVLGVNND